MNYRLQWFDGAGYHMAESNDLNGITTLMVALKNGGNQCVQRVQLWDMSVDKPEQLCTPTWRASA